MNKLYFANAYVGNYEISVVGKTPKQTIDALWKEYKTNWADYWGGRITKKEWLEYHDINVDNCQEIEIGVAWSR